MNHDSHFESREAVRRYSSHPPIATTSSRDRPHNDRGTDGRGDWELNTALLDREDYVFQPRGAGPGIVVGARETYLDVEGYMEVVSDWAEAFSEAQFLFEGAIEIDRHRSAALVRIVGVGSGSGIQVARTALPQGYSLLMSEENVALVRELFEMFAHRQHERALEYYDPDVLFDASRTPQPAARGVYHGREGVRAFWREWLSAWSDLQFELQGVLDAGDEVVALVRNQRQWGRHTGIETEFPPYAIVFTIRGGKVARWCWYPDQAAALEAAGLSKDSLADS